MKTKSFKIYTNDEPQNWLEVSETPSKEQILLRINGGGVIRLGYDAWKELMKTDYDLACNMPEKELSQIPDLASEADTADEHITQLKKEIENAS